MHSFNFFCSKKLEKKEQPQLPVVITSEYDSILPLNVTKMMASKPAVYGINILDTFCLSNNRKYHRENRTSSYPWETLRKDSLIIKIDTTFNNFTTNELAGFSAILPPPPPDNNGDDKSMGEYSITTDSLYNEILNYHIKRQKQHYRTFPLYIYNPTLNNIVLQMPLQGGDLYFIIEAIDQSDNWKPIEYWNQPSFLCATGHEDYVLNLNIL